VKCPQSQPFHRQAARKKAVGLCKLDAHSDTDLSAPEQMINPQEYRAMMACVGGRMPPCVQCNDNEVSHCMETGFECQKFIIYSRRVGDRKKRESYVRQSQ